jgi:hypothetical protein
MPAYYTPAEISAISDSVLHAMPGPHLRANHAGFTLRTIGLPQAWTTRVNLEAQLSQAVRAHSATAVVAAAEAVHKWGFGSSIPKEVKSIATFGRTLLSALVAFDGATPPYCAMRESALAALLDIDGIGIATASKWICFVDQSRFGIFDSRVSIALRDIPVAHARAFPIVPRQALQGKVQFGSDTQINSNPLRMARAYLDYLAVLSTIARRVRLDAAEVEMALFMIGDVWANGLPPLSPLRRGMWN